jgi:hypothetical protein
MPFDPKLATLPEHVHTLSVTFDDDLIREVLAFWKSKKQYTFTAQDLYQQLLKQGCAFGGRAAKDIKVALSRRLAVMEVEAVSHHGVKVFKVA